MTSETPAGPADAVIRLLDLRETALDATEVLAAVEDPTAGGVNLFVGVVRDHDGGESVDHLDYSAHPTALARLREVAEGVVRDFEVVALAAVHRTGTLRIGDTAVLVAASAAHRGQTSSAALASAAASTGARPDDPSGAGAPAARQASTAVAWSCQPNTRNSGNSLLARLSRPHP